MLTKLEQERAPTAQAHYYALQMRDLLNTLAELNELHDILEEQPLRERIDAVELMNKLVCEKVASCVGVLVHTYVWLSFRRIY